MDVKRIRVLILSTLAAAGLLLPGGDLLSSAHEATPVPVAPDLATFSTTLVGILPGVSLPSSADVVAVRAEFAPGVVVPFAAGADTAETLILVEQGELEITVANQPWNISREAVLNQAMATPAADGDLFQLSTTVAPGEPGTLGAGDMTLIPATADGDMRNTSTEPVTALMILMGPSNSGT